MATKSNRSSGTQITQKGVTQGVVLVDPITGNPVTVVFESGQYKLATTGSGGGGGPTSDVNVISSVPIVIKDSTSGYTFKINSDGSINANVEIDAADGDNILIVGTEDGTFPGTQRPAKIGSNGNLRVQDEIGNTSLASIDSKLTDVATETSLAAVLAQLVLLYTELQQKTEPTDTQLVNVTSSVLPTGAATEATLLDVKTAVESLDTKLPTQGQKPSAGSVPVVIANDQSTLPVSDTVAQTILTAIQTQLTSGTISVDDDQTQVLLNSIITQLQAGGIIIGTENGTPTGVQHVFVNNLRSMILASHDRVRDINYLDITNRRDRRIDSIEYTSATFPGITALRQFTYTLASGEYVLVNETWSII